MGGAASTPSPHRDQPVAAKMVPPEQTEEVVVPPPSGGELFVVRNPHPLKGLTTDLCPTEATTASLATPSNGKHRQVPKAFGLLTESE